MADNINKELTLVRDLDAPRDMVYRAWTDPELVAQWWGPDGVTSTVDQLDASPGGAIDIVMLAGEQLGDLKGSRWPMTGTFQELLPPEKIVYTSSAVMNGKPIMDTTSTVLFEENHGKTRLTLKIRVTRTTPEAEGPLAGMEMGWSQSLDKLVALKLPSQP